MKVKENLLKMTPRLRYSTFIFLVAALWFSTPYQSVFAQDTSPLVEIRDDFEAGKLNANEAILAQLQALENGKVHKCATPVSILAHKHWNELAESTISKYQRKIGAADIAATEFFTSASGKFIIRYETSGNDAVPSADENSNSVPDYVEWIAEAADSSYNRFIERGFTDIFSVKNMPFDIIVADGNAYGFVPPNAPYIGIENDFAGFPGNTDPEGHQKGAVKVTIAHELKHVFQFVQNGWSGDPDRWLEMDATLYEEVMYDEVNDYYNYLNDFGNGNYFGSPTSSIIPGSYEDITWALFFEERFGNTFWTKVWERIESQSPSISFLEAIEGGLSDFETSFEEAVIENFLWHYASGSSNFTPLFGFDESELYPGPRLQGSFVELQTELTNSQNMSRFSGRYFEFDLIQENNSLLKVDYTPSSSDVQAGLIAYYDDSSIETRFYTNPAANELSSNETGLSWAEIDRLGLVFFNSSSSQSQSFQFRVYDYVPTEIESPRLSQNYPNPFNPSTTINVALPFSQRVKLTVYDYLGREIRVLVDGVLGAGDNPLRFDALDLSSGIYFYRLETQEQVVTRKMTLIK